MSDRTYFYRAENTSSLGPSFIEHELPEGSIVLSPADVEKVRLMRAGWGDDHPQRSYGQGHVDALDFVLTLLDGKADA